MTDFEKLMQNSETMRMLKIGNPERSKDFGIPELQSGLFELERQTKAGLEKLIYTSPDPNGSIFKYDTALMLNNLGLDMETSRKLAEGGFASTATGIDTRSKSYTNALITKAQHAYWNEMRGVNTSLYRITGNPEFLKNAQEYDKKVFQNPVFESYGGFGDLVLDSVQPAISSAKFLLTSAILSWIPGGVANKIWGPAVAKLVAKGGGIAATGVNFLSTGYSQAGNVLYDVMQMTDGEGNTLPWDSPVGGILFHALAGLMGLVELGSMEMFPWYRQLKSSFTNREVAEYLKKGLAKSFLDITFKGLVGTGGEAVEEGAQSGLEDGFTNALKAMANKNGADFELISLGDSVKKGTKAFWDAGKSMFLTSFLSAGVGQGVYASKVRIEAAKNFKKSDNSQSIDASFVGVPRSAVADAKAEEAKKGEQAKSASADTEETKLDPIKVVNVGPRLSPVNDEELRKAAKAVNLGVQAMEVEVVEMPEIQAEDKFSLINRAALATGAKIIDGEELGFEDEQSMIKGMYLIAPSVEAVDDSSVGKVVTIRNENGELSKITMRVIPEDMSEEHVADPDIMFAEDPKAPYALSMMSEERALEWEERNLIRKALGDVTTHTKGRFSSADIEASIDAVKTVAETLDMPTDKLLSEGVVFHLTDKVQDEWGNEALGSITSNITVDGKKQYTINLSRKANVSTVLHELGHLLRGFATKEQLAEFRKYYGEGEEAAFLEDINFTNGKYHVGNQIFDTIEDARDYVIGNEERFADDFVAYMMTGEAPTEGLKNIFRRMKAVLHRFIAQYGNRLAPEVKEAFDNLIAGKLAAGVNTTGVSSTDASTLFQLETNGSEFTEIYNRYIDTDQWLKAPNGNPTNLTAQQWVQVRTPAFIEWFGDWMNDPENASKIVDENGEPLVVYHGTIQSFNTFKYGDLGFHFGSKDQAETRVEDEQNPIIMKVYLSIKNPYHAEYDYGSWDGYYVARKFLEREEFTDDADVSVLKDIAKRLTYRSNLELRKFLRDKGYDGVVYPNRFEGESEKDSYIAFSPTQIKSVNNQGTWDAGNPNILFQKDLSRAEYAEVYDRYYNTDQWMKAPNGEWSNLNEQQWVTVRTPSFLNWFGNWIDDPKSVELALDENGEPEVFYHGSYTDDIEIFKIQPRLGYYFSDKNRGGFSFTNNREMAESYAVPQQKRVKAISNYLRELERALEDEGIVDLDSLEDPDNASPRLKRFYELLEEDEATAGETFEGRLPTFEYVYWDGDEFPFRQGREMWSKHVPRAIEKEFPELAKRLRKAGRDLRVGKGMTTPKVYEVFLRIPEGTNTKNLTPKTLHEIGDFFDVSKEKTGAFVVLMPEGEKVAYIADSKMIKSATDNAGTFDGGNPNILYQKDLSRAEYAEVYDRYYNTDQWMKAPNGKPTNLTEKQWKQVRTPEFIKWFGDWMNDPENASKVVDENGEPKVVYHSTNTEFEAFDTSDKSLDFTIPNNRGDNIGAFFTTSARNSKYFGNNTMEVYLSIQNPKVFDTQDNFREFVRSNFKMEEETLTESAKFSNDTRRILEEQGYDGVIIKKAQFGGKTSKESWYVAFSPTQIKSATDNIGTFDAGNPSILYQRAGDINSDEFKTWFKGSKVINKDGSPKVMYHGSPNVFDAFSKQRSSYGYFFTPDKATAGFYGSNMYAVYLASSNPAYLDEYETRKAVLKYAFGDEYDPVALGRYLESRYYGHDEFGVLGDLWELDSAEEQDSMINRVVEASAGSDDYEQILEDVVLFREGIAETGVDANRSYGSQDFYLNYQDDVLRAAEDMGFDGVSMTDPSSTGLSESFVVFKPTQVKSVDNQGTWDAGNPNILYQKSVDDRYFEALDRGDEETARKIVDDMARKRGYLSGNDFRMNHKAPNGRNDYDVNLPNLDGSELLPKDFWDHPRWYAGDHELYSFWKVKEAIDRYRRNGKANIRLYRAVPKDVREDWFRNGDWVTPDREYARTEGLGIPGGYRIIFHSVPIEHVWWDVNSIAELGYDDGGEYVYRNTKNNRKLFDTVVRDADGNIVPPSKRFNFRSDTLYQKAPKEGTKEFEQTFALTKIVDENGNPRMVYHGSMREWQGADAEFDSYEIGSQSDPGDAGEGFYFATTPLGAYAYTNGKQDNVHGYYLDIRNPFVIGEQYDRETTQALKAKGYDGVIYGDEIVAFDPGQIYYASKPATLYQIEAYHGTSKDFDKFSTDFIGSGSSGGVYGWGLYFTTDEDVARNYAEIVGNRNLEKRVLYRINLGRIGKHTLLPWSEPINERVRSMLREPMLKLEYPQSLHRQYGTSTTEELVSKVFGGNATGNSLYFFLEKAFDDWSGKKVSLFLREHGITGTVKSDLMGNYTYAIFDENAVEIVGKTLYKMAPPSGTEDFKKWYGSSVLVDGKGNPIEVLHGSPSMFNDFARTQENDNGYLGAGHYFTGIRGIALTYATKNNDGYIYHAYLKMENPLRYDQEWDKKWTEIRNEVVAENPEVPEYSNLFGKLLAEKLQDNGYDGVLDMRNGTVAEAVVFSNDQIGIVAVESYNLGEAGSEYNRRKIGEMRQRQIAKKAVQQAIPDLSLAQENLVPPTLYQVQNLPKWKEDTRAWMKANGYTGAQIDRHIAGIEGQLKIFDFVGPYEIDLLPHGAGLNPWKRVTQQGNVTYQGGPIRTNIDPIYRISFDLSAMCPKRLSAAATANYVQKKIGRPLSDSERMALTALYRAHGKEAPCIYCYVESPRSKASSLVRDALEVVLGGDAPKTWKSETLSLAEEARAEAVAKNVQRGDLNAHALMDPELASSDEFKAEVDKYPAIYKFLKKQMLSANANLPKLYEEYEGQILNLPDDFIEMLNGYAGIRFFSSSDFQAQHVVDLIQAVYDMNVRGAKAHAYTKVPKFVEIFGGTGIKINTSIFAKEENGQIVEDNWQGMGWEDAKRFRQQYDNVGSILVASSDNIVKWALEQDWIDYIIPFHYSSLEKKYYSTMNWEDFTSTQVEKPINVGEEVQKIRQFETGSVGGISNAEGTRRYLELAMQRGIIPVFPTFLFNDGMEDVVGKHGKPYKNQRKARTDRAIARWREMVESGEIDWSQINPNYYKLRKDYARTDTPFGVVQPNFDLSQASDVLKEYLSGAAEGVQGEREIGDELVRMIIDSEGTDINLGIEVLRGVQEGRMSGKETLFQRMSPPGSQEFMSWYKGSMLVDVDGAPLKLYHGTASIFTEYNSEYGTLNMGDSEGSEGFFFTTDKDEAISYAEFAVSPEVMAYKDEHRAVLRKMGELGVKRGSDHPLEERALELERKITEEEDLIGIGAQAWDPVVSGVYVRITNPAIIDLSDPDITGEIDFQQLIQEAKASGHDGFIYKNVNESDVMHVVAFSDSQVGAVEYSLSSEGYEMDHEFPAQYMRRRGALPGNDSYVFERGKTLYQLSDEARKRVVESRKEDVRKAIENYYWIPDDVLQEYIGEDWADREIRFRTRLKENPWVLEEARGYTDPDEYLEFVTSRDMQDGKESSAEAKRWWRRVYEYARVESAAERNLRFVREHTSTDKDLIALGNRLRSYIETDQETGKRYFRWGTFKGVSPLVKSLTAKSSSEDIQKARALVADNPEPYRKALQKIVQAERIVYNDGKFDLPSQEDREAYYDSLGEEMSDALNEPLLINQLSGGEDAEFLRTLDHRESYTEREKMATLNGVLEIENQADKELAALRSEYDRKANSLTELQKRFDIVTREVNKLGDELRKVRKDRSSLKRKLKGTQETAVNLREALAEKREAYRKLERERKALERKLHAVRTRRDLEKYHKAILASAKFNPDSVDASYEEALNTIYDLFRQDREEGGYKMLPEMLTRYLDDEGLHAIKTNKRIGDWSLDELMTLYYAIRAMKADARVMLERKKVDRSGKLQNLAIKYYRQLYGELPEIDPLVGGVMGSIMEELSIKQKKYQEGMFGAIWNTVAGAMIHSQRLARIIDGNREGVMYDLLVRRAYENSSKELARSFERLEAAEAKMRELGVTDKSLRKDLYTYTTIAGDEITLTRGEVLGLYVYGQNELGMEKLIMPWGNGIQPGQLAEAVGKLTDAEKAWGDYMIDELGGDDPWERMRDVYYNVYNKNLGRRERYFTFVADGNLNEGNTDILNGPKGRPVRYTDKGMTKEVVPHARYALKLDVTRTFTQQVKRQEHFIAWAEWVRDMNYLLSSRGSIGAMIEANHGSKILTQVQDFVNDIGSPQVILDDIERLGNKILSNAVVGALSFNALTPLKQLASLSAVVRGDIDISSLFHAARRLGNPAIHDKVVKMIHEKSPKMKNRTFDVEVAKYNATEFDTELGMAIKAINEKVGMKAIQWMDQLVANLVWLSAYDTALKKGATDAEAAFRATEVVGETQSSTNISDLSSLQRKKSPWVRSMLMFTNDIVQHLNQIWFDLPYYVRSKQYRKAFGTMANVAIAGAISLLVSGQLFRGDDDDEEYLKKIAKAILEIIVSDTIPVVGNAVASGVSGWAGGDMVDLPSAFGRFLGAAADLEGEKLLDAFLNLIEAGLKFGALPVTAGNRVVRAVREQNPLHLLNYDYAELWESWL